MKKKLLLTLFAAMLFTVILALGISASTVYKDEGGNTLFSYELDEKNIISTYTGEFPKTDEDGNHLTWYVKSTASEGGNTVKTVASFLTMDESYMTLSNGIYTYKSGTGVTSVNIVAVSFPQNSGITKLNLANSGYRNAYAYSSNTAEILFIYLPNTLTELPERVAQSTRALVCHIPMETPITTISRVAFHDSKCLREINIPSSVTLIDGKNANDGAAFYSCDSLEKVYFGENSQLTTVNPYAFHRCVKLNTLRLPDSVTTVGTHAFSYTALVDSPFGEGSRCETLGGRAFSDIPTLKRFIVPATLKKAEILGSNDYGPLALCTGIELVTFGNSAPVTELLPSFFGRATIEKIILPNGPTNIPNRYFTCATLGDVTFSDTIETASERVFQAATVRVIRLGANFKYFVNSAVDHQSFTNAVNGLKEVYIPASFYAVKPETSYQVSYALDCGSSSAVKFFYTGTSEQLATALDNFKNGTISSGTNNWKFLNATQVSYEEYFNNMDKYSSGYCIVYDYDPCDAFCEPFYTDEAKPTETIVYESFLESGVKTAVCPFCGGYSTGEKAMPLFVSQGYSVPENGEGGISVCFALNESAIYEYELATGKSVSYGVFAAGYDNLGDKDIFDENGDFLNIVIGAKIENEKIGAFEVKVVGFSTEAQKSARLVIGAYVIEEDGEERKVSYMQESAPSDGEKYSYVVFNDMITE